MGLKRVGHNWATEHSRMYYVLVLLTWDCEGFGGQRRRKRKHYLLKCNWFQDVYSWVETYISNHSWKIRRRQWHPTPVLLPGKSHEQRRLQSMGSLRVGHNWAISLSLFTFMHWRRKWQPTLVFLPGESQGWQSLVGCCLWGRTESDTTEAT